MVRAMAFQEAYDKIYPLVETYFDKYFTEEELEEMPSFDVMQEVAKDLKGRLLREHPEVRSYLIHEREEEVSVAFYGCGCFLWLILIGVAFKKCGRKKRFNRRRKCDRGFCDRRHDKDFDDFKRDKPFRFY